MYQSAAALHNPATTPRVPAAWLHRIGDNLADLATPQGCMVEGGAGVDPGSVNGFDTPVEWTTVLWANGQTHSPTSDPHVLLATSPGLWRATVSLTWVTGVGATTQSARFANQDGTFGLSPIWRATVLSVVDNRQCIDFVVSLPAGSGVGLWLAMTGPTATLAAGRCFWRQITRSN